MIALLLCVVGTFAVAGTAGADPYPPVLPTGQVPAVATVPAPGLGGPVAPAIIGAGLSPLAIAPGSYPVQARTGAGPASTTSDHTVLASSVLALVLAGLLGAFFAVRRTRRVR